MSANENKRSFFRITDNIALVVNKLAHSEADNIESYFRKNRAEYGLANEFIMQRELNSPLLKKIAAQNSNVAEYISFLEENILALARAANRHLNDAPSEPDHAVNLSGNGLQYLSTTERPEGELLELTITLFPSQATIYTIGTVKRAEKTATGKWSTAIHFTHLQEDDQEILVKHVHSRQLNTIQQLNRPKNTG
ncbi:MAG: PilZ domain-containing protein [Thiotrichales bacterium]